MLSITYLKQDLSLKLAGLTSWPASSRDPAFSSSSVVLGSQTRHTPIFYVGAGESNLGPDACIASDLLTEPSPQSLRRILTEKIDPEYGRCMLLTRTPMLVAASSQGACGSRRSSGCHRAES